MYHTLPIPYVPSIKSDKFGILFRWKSFWVGCHYSDHCRRFCLNIVPCVTIWWTIKGGQAPRKTL